MGLTTKGGRREEKGIKGREGDAQNLLTVNKHVANEVKC